MTSTFRQMCRLASYHPIRAAIIAFWFMTRRRVRAYGQLAHAYASLPFLFNEWAERVAQGDMAAVMPHIQTPPARSIVSVHIHIDALNVIDASAAIASVIAQSWPHWRLIVTTSADGRLHLASLVPADERIVVVDGVFASHSAALVAALREASTAYLVPLRRFCRLPKHSLLGYARLLQSPSMAEEPVIYGDQIEFSGERNGELPWFKPAWDLDMFLAQDYLSSACALPVGTGRKSAAGLNCALDECASIYALLLDLVTVQHQRVEHLHRVAVATPPDHWALPCPDRLTALRRSGVLPPGADVSNGTFGTTSIKWPLPADLPLVSIVIPTRDRLDLLQPCVDGILYRTSYPNLEIIIADNDSVEPATRSFFEMAARDPRVHVVSWPFPYNYSAINNFAVGHTRGEFLCLLNNDIEIIDENWLSELMRHASRTGVGAVGARLLYPDRSIQHAGVAVGLGNAAGHAHRGLRDGDPGYFAHALITREATAVTAACLVVSRQMFDTVGGLDDKSLRIAYNDVDFCLKIRETGARNIYAATAVLIHHESKSRGLDMAPEHFERYMTELAVFQARWNTASILDPTHHPMLDRSSETYRAG